MRPRCPRCSCICACSGPSLPTRLMGIVAPTRGSCCARASCRQLLMIANFSVALLVATRPYASEPLGGRDTPEFPAFQWIAMVLCTLLAGGGVFWAAAEPVAHYVSLPPLFTGIESGSAEAVPVALSQSFLHWGFLAWAILGSLTAVILMRLHYDRGLPLAPRTLLFPLTGEKGVRGPLGDIADVVAILAVFAGTVGPIGFLGLQISYGLSTLYGTPDTTPVQLVTIAGLMLVYLISAVSGMHRGIQLLSRINVVLGCTLLLFLLTGLITSMATRTPLILDVIRDRNTLYREVSDGMVENIYTLKIINQRNDQRSFALGVEGLPGIELDGIANPVVVEGGGVLSVPVRARAHRDNAYGVNNIIFSIEDVEDTSVAITEDSRFLGPTP